MTEEQAKELLHKYSLGLCTPEEEQAIVKWADNLGATPNAAWTAEEKAVFFQLLDKQINALTGLDIQTNAAPAVVVQLDQQDAQRKRGWGRWVAAASILLITTASIYYFTNRTKTDQSLIVNNSNDVLPGRNGAILTLADGKKVVLDSLDNGTITMQGKTTVALKNGRLMYDATSGDQQVLMNTMTTPKGRQYQLVLPDGTKVWLNAASSITYPTAFVGKERSVNITGEAYFEVTKNKEKPFMVDIDGRSTVQVLGTHFNVNSYADEGNIMTTLLEGSVKVAQTGSTGRTVTLRPGQQAVVSSRDAQLATSIAVNNNADIEEVMAWKNGYFLFNETSLSSVLKQLARWYDVEVAYQGAPPAKTFVGEIPRDATLSQVMKALERIGVHFQLENKKIIVTQ